MKKSELTKQKIYEKAIEVVADKGYSAASTKEIAHKAGVSEATLYKYTSRPIMANALGLAIGLSALLLSPLRIQLYVSILMWVSMLSGVFLSLSFLPTILKK